MNVWLKRILFGLVIALIIAVVGLAIFLLTFNPNAYKSRLEDLVHARYDRTLTIRGAIGLSLFPRIGLSVGGVSLSDRGKQDLFVSVDSARFAVAIWPLLSNRLVVDHVAISGLKAWVVRDARGHFNFDDLLDGQHANGRAGTTASAAPASAARPAAGVAPSSPTSGVDSDLNIDIAGLELKGGEIHFLDLRDGISTTMAGIEASTGRVTFDQPFDVTVRATLKGDDPVQDAKLDAQALLRLNPGVRGYAAQKINVQLSGRLGNLTQARTALKGNLTYDGRGHSFSAGNLELTVAGDIVGRHPVQGLQASLSAAQLSLDRRNGQLKVSKLALRMTGKDQGRAVDIALDAPALAISPDAAKGDPVTGTFKWTGSETLGASLRLEGLSGNANEWQFRAVALDANLAQDKRLLRLKLTSPLSWNHSLRKGAFSAIKGDVAVQDRALPEGGYEAPMIGSVHLDLTRDVLDADLNAVLDGGQAGFKAQVTQLADPQVDFSFSSEKLDLNRWLPMTPPAAGTAPVAGKPEVDGKAGDKPAGKPADKAAGKPADKPAVQSGKAVAAAAPAAPAAIDLSFLKGRNIKGTVKIGDLRVRNVQLTGTQARLAVQKGVLTVSQLMAHLYQGTLTGQLSATADQDFAARLNLDKVSVAPFMQALDIQGALSGQGSVQADLHTRGKTVPALERALAGRVALQIRDGAIHGVDAGQTLSDVASALGNVLKGRLDAVASPFQKGRSTPFSSLDGQVDFKEGVGTVSRLALAASLVHVTEGRPAWINLPERSLDLLLQVQVTPHPPKALSSALGSLPGATIPIEVSGAWADPHFDVHWGEVRNQAVQQALKSGLMQLLSGKDLIEQALPAPEPESGSKPSSSGSQADTVERLGNALKGLLGQ